MDNGFGLSHEQRNWMPALVLPIQIVTTVLLWIRLIARFRRTGGQFGLDDVFIAVAWILGTGVSAAVLLGTYRYGFNRHIWDVPENLWSKDALVGFIVEVLFLFSTCLTKISVLMFYRRLIAGTCSQAFKRAIWGAIAFVVVYTIVFFVLLITNCKPLEAIWLQVDFQWTATHKYKCVGNPSIVAGSKAAGALSVVSDFYSVMFPAVLLMRIRINERQRYGLMFIFGIGYLVVAAGIARTVYLGRVQGAQPDKTWFAFNVFAASVAECNIAIICACAPSLKSLFGKYFRDLTTKITGSGDSSLSSRMASRVRGKLGFDKFPRGAGSKKGMSSSAASTGRRPSTTHELPKMSTGMDRGSFKETHEYGMETLGYVSEAYEEPPSSRKNSKASVPMLLDLENNVMVARMISSPLTPAYPGRLSAMSPLRSPLRNVMSDDDARTVGENPSFSFVAFNASDSSSNEDEMHLMSAKDDFVPLSPRQLQRSSSRLSDSQSLRTSDQLRSPSPALISSRGSSVVAPWSELTSEQQIERSASERTSDGARPKGRRKLSKDKWDGSKALERTSRRAI